MVEADAGIIGRSPPRDRARRAVAGRGRYTGDIQLPHMAHAAFVRSPYAHAEIRAIDTEAAYAVDGVVAVVTGVDVAAACQPFVALHNLFPQLRSAPQHAVAVDRARWQGEPIAAVVAESRAVAEDAAELVEADLEPLPAIATPEAALDPTGPAIHPELGSNIALEMAVGGRPLGAPFPEADLAVEETFRFGRHTGVCLEPRAILADYDPSEDRLTVYQSHQCPHQMQDIYARLLGIPEHNVRVHCPDVGGAFGIKQQLYGDEIAVCVLSRLLGRPVKFVADRLESFGTDVHARDHTVKARLAVRRDGRILGLEVDDLFAIGPYNQYPRSSVGEGNHVLRMSGAPYALTDYRARLTMVFQNKNLVGHYRSVGHPIACAVTESMVDRAARALGLDPAAIRRMNYLADDAYPYISPSGALFERLSLHACQDKLEALIDLEGRRAEQEELRARGIYRGIGLATFVELTGPGPDYYGAGGVRATAQDGVLIKLEPSGKVRCWASVTELGQGIDTGIQQVVADTLGVGLDDVRVFSGDSETSPYGGGAWASRGAMVGGEAALMAARELRGNLLEVAGLILQAEPAALDIRGGIVVDATGVEKVSVAELAGIAHFRQDTLPSGYQPNLAAVRHFVPRKQAFVAANGIQASYVEVDVETGFVRLLEHAVVHDAGTVINPLLVDEQIRGGVAQGIGAALFEEILYSDSGQIQNATMADYLVPMSADLPDIMVSHVSVPTQSTELGAKGVGEAGVAGSAAAVLNAVNDALAPLGASIAQIPLTPERILRALGRI